MTAETDTAVELWTVFLAHPIPLILGAVATISAGFIAGRFAFDREVSTLRTQRDGYKEERDTLRADAERLRSEVDRLRSAAPVPVIPSSGPPPSALRDATNDYLRSRTRQMAETLREIQEQHSTHEGLIGQLKSTEEDAQRAWEETMRRYDQRRTAIARRYSQIRGEVVALKEEMMRRVHPSVVIGRSPHVDILYEMQAGPNPFHVIADDLERYAAHLP